MGPFREHACHFYSSTDQLVAALVPYAVAGLRGNERCLWVTAPLLPAREHAPRVGMLIFVEGKDDERC